MPQPIASSQHGDPPNRYPSETGAVIVPMLHRSISPSWAQEILRRCPLILVSDGLEPEEEPALQELQALGCILLRHAVPLGLGRCVKTGIHYYLSHYPDGKGVILSGQEEGFAPVDLDGMLQALSDTPLSMTLGVSPPPENIPWKRRAEYWICRQLFAVVCGKKLRDVRAPLGARPRSVVERAVVLAGGGEEYMLNLLLVLCRNTVPIQEIPVARHAPMAPIPLVMWGKLILVIISFLFSSLASAIIDYAIFIFMNTQVTPVLLTCQVVARAISSVFNFTLNHKLVFAPRTSGKRALGSMLVKYYLLVATSLCISTALLYLFSHFLGIPALLAKPVVELIMYGINFVIQRDIVFKTRKHSAVIQE